MIAIPIPWNRNKWSTLSFTSTLYLCPVLDLLLVDVPLKLQPEVRLGLQEALVNAAKHGNNLDPNKTIIVRFAVTTKEYSWTIADQGCGLTLEGECANAYHNSAVRELPGDEAENGRGFSILHEVFDCVHWNREGTQLTLSKAVSRKEQPAIR